MNEPGDEKQEHVQSLDGTGWNSAEKSVSNQQGADTGDDKEGGCGIFTKHV